MQEKSELNLKDVGARFRSVRSLVNVNRKTFCERHNINKYTLQSWENGIHVSKGKNVEKFIEALAKEGIHCHEDWLLYGAGEGPKITNSLVLKEESLEKINNSLSDSDLKILNNIKDLYQKNHEEILIFRLLDDHMSPKYSKGDFVIGKKSSNTIGSIHQKDCIIDLGLERFMVRRALVFKDKIMLLALDQSQPTFILGLDAKLFPIIWHLLGN